MTDATQPRMARGTTLSAGFIAAALFALLAFAPFASAAPDPVASGTTTITLKSGVVNAWKKRGVKLSKVSPGTLKGSKATFPVTGGSLDPTTGLGTVNHGGGLKFKAGSKTATVKVPGGQHVQKRADRERGREENEDGDDRRLPFARNGFGVNLTIKSLKLTGPAAKQLNKKLGYTGKNKRKAKPRSKRRPAVQSQPGFRLGDQRNSAENGDRAAGRNHDPGG